MTAITPSPIQTWLQEVSYDEPEETLCDLIKRICEMVASCFASIFCCCLDEKSDLWNDWLNDETDTLLPKPSIPAIIPPPSSSQASGANVDLRVNQTAVAAIGQIANAYAGYLQYPIEPIMAQYPSVFSSNRGSLRDRLVYPYVGSYYTALNTEMRQDHSKYSPLQGPLNTLNLKVYAAHLQQNISSSSDRITENHNAKHNRTVYRKAHCPTVFVKNYFTPNKINEGIFLANRSFLSTSSTIISFDSDNLSSQPCTHLSMRIKLQSDTPIFDVLQHDVSGMLDEYEILLPAGRAFKVRSYDPDTFLLELEEVSPDAIDGTLLTTAL